MNKRNSLTVLMKPTHDCKMGCEYCFDRKLRHKDKNAKMTIETVNQTLKVIAKSNIKNVELTWHGGECTLMGIEFYKEVFELLNVYRNFMNINVSMQSGGLHLNEEWYEFMKTYGFKMGLSFDGLYQDFRRKGTQEFILKKIKDYKEHMGEPLGFINVINEHSYKNIIDNYEYFKEQGIPNFSFNFVTNPNPGDDYDGIKPKDFSDGTIKYYKHWLQDKDAPNERTATGLTNFVMGELDNICNHSDCRGGWISVHPLGDIYNCSHFYPEEYSYGNIWEVETVDDIFGSEGFKLLNKAVDTRRDTVCKQCDLYEYCYGGCLSDHFSGTKDYSKVDRYQCKTFELNLVGAYKALKELDIYNSNDISPYILKNIVSEGRFLFKEIQHFLRMNGLDINKLEFNENDMVNCDEYKLFRIFNPKRMATLRNDFKRNFRKYPMEDVENIPNNSNFKRMRFEDMARIYNDNKEEIHHLFNGGVN